MKKLPWASLALLLVTYSTFGWLLYTWTPWRFWLLAVAFVLLIALVLTTPERILSIFFGGVLKSELRVFIAIIFGSFFAVVFLRWFGFFADFLLLIAAAMLARLDMQIAGFSKLQAFSILAVVSLAGVGMGLLIHQEMMIYHLF